jgi:hypothetical protein
LVVGVVVVRLCVVGVVVVGWSRSPAGAVEGLATGFATATRSYAAERCVSRLLGVFSSDVRWDGCVKRANLPA